MLAPATHTLPCRIEAPDAFVPKARYALEELLRPLGLQPVWTDREALDGGLYYGPSSEAPPGVLALPLAPDAVAYFDRAQPYDAARAAWVEWGGERWPILFGGAQPDLVASAFFWLSGWQEHVLPVRDAHGRFPAGASLQAVWQTFARPAVDAYREMLAERLVAAGRPLARRTWNGRAWVFCPTHDIDYLRKWRPGILYREFVQYALLNRRRVSPASRVERLRTAARDWLRPGDPCRTAFERMQTEVERRGGTATYFLKTAARDAHDVSYRLDDPFLCARVDALQRAGFEIGLHPAYLSHDRRPFLEDERDRLVGVIGERPVSVRQHYLRYTAPETSRLHAALGFRVDSTLGFGDHEGFRHATCLPFRIFDIPANAPLDLYEMPLAIMESTLFNRRNLDAEGARAATSRVLDACARFGGACVALWHNTLWDEMDYPGWGRHFTDTLDAAVERGALVASLRDALAHWR